MPETDPMRNRDLVLPPNSYAYVLATTTGKVSAYVGPHKTSLSETDRLVFWDAAQQRFPEATSMAQAVMPFALAGEGQYVVLLNPAPERDGFVHPPKGTQTEAVDLLAGRRVNVPGPVTFALWPGQVTQTLDGHHLRHNQYLIVRVYDVDEATRNWTSAVVATQAQPEDGTPVATATPPTLTMGQLMVIKGTDVSFYIPPTGVEVVAEGATISNSMSYGGTYVREAVTLEQLEYCILLDEDGEKRYVPGPAVVFPEPTEKFVTDDGKTNGDKRKFRAIELNPHSGVYVKVIAEYREGGTHHPVGEELFITGLEQAIYFPRAEHAIIRYGETGRQVHYAIAIPEGEGRYVLDRDTGEIKLVRGPSMYLPDPRKEVVVLRILDPQTCELLYPGNDEAVQINMERAGEALDFDESQRERRLRTTGRNLRANLAATTTGTQGVTRGDEDFDLLAGAANVMHSYSVAAAGAPAGSSGVMRRGTSYSKPRSIVLDTKYEGAVTANIWPGYAVLIVNKADERRVEVGPKMVLLEYDESILPLELSTGRPKNDTNLLRTGYLRTINNAVGDQVVVETKDLVEITLDISYRVNFEGDTPEEQQRWFALENYVKVLTDHCRSRLRGEAKRHNVMDFYTKTIDIIRDSLLGAPTQGQGRAGMTFDDNGMRLVDVEVLDVRIEDEEIDDLLQGAQKGALTGAIELQAAEEMSARTTKLQELRRQDLDEADKTTKRQVEIAMLNIARGLEQRLAELDMELRAAQERTKVSDLELETVQYSADVHLAIDQARQEVELARVVAETEEWVKRMGAVEGNVTTALAHFGDTQFVEALVTALGPIAATMGVTTSDLFARMFKGTPFEGAVDALTVRPFAELNS